LRYAVARAVLILLACALRSEGRSGEPPRSFTAGLVSLSELQMWAVPAVDVRKALADATKGSSPLPVKYAEPFDTDIEILSMGTWETLPNGDQIWRLLVQCEGATDLNFGFSEYEMPEGAALHIVEPGGSFYQGPYTAKDNKPHRQLWTPVVPGDTALLELYLPSGIDRWPRLTLARVGRGFRDLFKLNKAGDKQGSCNVDVICSDGDDWRDQIRSAAVYSTGGSLFCSGTMIMNEREDFRNYFLTANHCSVSAGDAPSLVVYWNFESPVCGALSGGSLADNQSGAIFRAAKSDSDFCLLELEDDPNPSFNVYYSGWDRSGGAPTGAVAIHHPNCDEKAISFCTNVLIAEAYYGGAGSATHWKVPRWIKGTTEPGSSGSGLWDANTKLLVGQLHGGDASCSATTSPDWYGRLFWSWDIGTTSADRLRDWLDPDNTSTTRVYGADPGAKLGKVGIIFPQGGEQVTTGLLVSVLWNSNSAPAATRGEVEFTAQASGDRPPYFFDNVESGIGDWKVGFLGGGRNWAISTTQSSSPTHSWFGTNQSLVSEMYLVRTGQLVQANTIFAFRHRVNLEAGYDGGVVEISTNGAVGPWADLGSAMIEGGYTYQISTSYSSPIGGRWAFSGNNGSFQLTRISLSAYAGKIVALRFKLATDSSAAAIGWWVDDISLSQGQTWEPVGVGAGPSSWVDWVMPVTPGTDYCVRVRQMAKGFRTADWQTGGVFSVVAGGISTDADGDGIPDDWEARHSGTATRLMPDEDDDDDSFTNLEEFLADTNPENPVSYPKLSSVFSGPGLSVGVASTNTRRYQLLFTTNLVTPNWLPLGTPVDGQPGSITILEDASPVDPSRFYIIDVFPP